MDSHRRHDWRQPFRFENIEGTLVHLDAVDWETYGSLRLRMIFEGLDASSMPSVESITAGGLLKDTFSTDPMNRGWAMNNSTYLAGSITSIANGTVHSPWFTSNSPLAGYQIAATMQEYDAYVRHDEADAWVAITLPYSGHLTPTSMPSNSCSCTIQHNLLSSMRFRSPCQLAVVCIRLRWI